jgi:cytochrome b involved in lipid metabolism
MKKFVTASLFVFIAIIAGVVIVGFVSNNAGNKSVTGLNTSSTNQINKVTGVSPTVATLKLSNAELAKHNSSQSCWLLISGKIYDVTTYLNSHPGGEGEILKTCGTDATIIYDNRDGTGSHSSRARSMLTDYYIGDLNQTIKIGS